MDAERRMRIAGLTETARPVWEGNPDGEAFQEYLKGVGCDGVDAVLVTKAVVGCDLGEAQTMFLTAPCRAAELAFHNSVMEGLERSQ
ncbi:hypothetical protein QEZ40_003599 [Streptomyces katrae]|uniref:Helicase C-terminal domain-containing protein n=1 Tax=Streptomyces katrae TaxID=68223 RepID=A0ABT7GXQ6_9ACTN|nr:hypothetical protein [Streptomyces katrae]MDK9498417.1 hypothetical protein [Streptomyces katrae]